MHNTSYKHLHHVHIHTMNTCKYTWTHTYAIVSPNKSEGMLTQETGSFLMCCRGGAGGPCETYCGCSKALCLLGTKPGPAASFLPQFHVSEASYTCGDLHGSSKRSWEFAPSDPSKVQRKHPPPNLAENQAEASNHLETTDVNQNGANLWPSLSFQVMINQPAGAHSQ